MDNNIDNNNDTKLTDDLTNRSNGGRILTGVIIVVVLAAVFFGLSKLPKNKVADTNVTTNKNVGLSDQDKSTLEAKVKDLQAKIAAFAVNVDPLDKLSAYLDLAETQEKLGLYPDAIATLNKVPPENQNNPRLWLTYAAVYRGSGDLAKARENAQKALDLNNKNPNAWKEFIEDSKDQGNDTLNSLYAQAVNNTNNNIDFVTAYARFLEQIGNKDAAIYYWQKAKEVNSASSDEYDKEIARLQGK